MSKRPQDTSAEEPDGGNPHIRFRGGPRQGDRPGLLNKKSGSQKSECPSELIDARIKELGDWRGKMLSRLRTLVKEADPEVVEEWKWRGVPVWSHAGIICTGETYKNVVKMTFAKGASLEDPSGLFNSSLEGDTRRAIDFHEGDKIDEKALKALIRAAVALNVSSAAQRAEARA
jgi:hypothetical protein